jgi:hypothetical protein
VGRGKISNSQQLYIIHLRTGFFLHNRNISAVKRVKFVSDRMLHITLKGHWCVIIVLNVHAPAEDKEDDIKDSLYKELEQVFDQFPSYHMKNLLGDFNAKVEMEDFLN